MKKYIKIVFIILVFCLFSKPFKAKMSEKDSTFSKIEVYLQDPNPCIKMYGIILKLANKYNVPVGIIYGVAHKESGYSGLAHNSYIPNLIGNCTYGAMQIKLSTAKLIWKDSKITVDRLTNDIEFNVETSVKLLSILKESYGTWGKALGAYNTGKPIVNNYAKEVLNLNLRFNINNGIL